MCSHLLRAVSSNTHGAHVLYGESDHGRNLSEVVINWNRHPTVLSIPNNERCLSVANEDSMEFPEDVMEVAEVPSKHSADARIRMPFCHFRDLR